MSTSRLFRAALAAAIPLMCFSVVAASCGGDDDDDGATPTVVATATPSFSTRARAAVEKLDKETGTALKDMTDAQGSQSDPKWPGVLTADADLVIKAGTALKELAVPPDQAALGKQLAEAATKGTAGAEALKLSIQNADQAKGAEAFAGLTESHALTQVLLGQLK